MEEVSSVKQASFLYIILFPAGTTIKPDVGSNHNHYPKTNLMDSFKIALMSVPCSAVAEDMVC